MWRPNTVLSLEVNGFLWMTHRSVRWLKQKKKYYSFKSGNLEDKYKETGGSWRLLHSTIKPCFRYLDSYLKMLRIFKKKKSYNCVVISQYSCYSSTLTCWYETPISCHKLKKKLKDSLSIQIHVKAYFHMYILQLCARGKWGTATAILSKAIDSFMFHHNQ